MLSEEQSFKEAVRELQAISDSKKGKQEETEIVSGLSKLENALNLICADYISTLTVIRKDAELIMLQTAEIRNKVDDLISDLGDVMRRESPT